MSESGGIGSDISLWHAHSEQDAVNINETYKNLIAE